MVHKFLTEFDQVNLIRSIRSDKLDTRNVLIFYLNLCKNKIILIITYRIKCNMYCVKKYKYIFIYIGTYK